MKRSLPFPKVIVEGFGSGLAERRRLASFLASASAKSGYDPNFSLERLTWMTIQVFRFLPTRMPKEGVFWSRYNPGSLSERIVRSVSVMTGIFVLHFGTLLARK